MQKKLQVFISSTFLDLRVERQAAVEAILAAGHLPAGMELFAAADESQLQIIYQWIEASDAFMLLLGGRYGSIEEKTGKSYTHLEYEHAFLHKKRPFALVTSDASLRAKVKEMGPDAIETANGAKYKDFKKLVESHQCSFFSDAKDIKIELAKAIRRLEEDASFRGWVPGPVPAEIAALQKEIDGLRQQNAALREKAEAPTRVPFVDGYQGLTFEELCEALARTKVKPPAVPKGVGVESSDLLSLLVRFSDDLALGIDNRAGSLSPQKGFLLLDIAKKLIPFGLVEEERAPGDGSVRLRTTPLGNRFLMALSQRRPSGTPPAREPGSTGTRAQRPRPPARRTAKKA